MLLWLGKKEAKQALTPTDDDRIFLQYDIHSRAVAEQYRRLAPVFDHKLAFCYYTEEMIQVDRGVV